jgi:lipopolysaccharide export system protein LptA
MNARTSFCGGRALLAALVLAVAVTAVHAAPAAPKGAAPPPNSGPPNALQGFSQNRDQPVKIQAASLEVRDKQKQATFAGDVHLVQGDTDLRCRTLVVFYDEEGGKGGNTMQAAQPGPNGSQQIRRMEVKGGVVVTQKESTATGENGVFDMKANTVTLNGNVVVTRGPDVLRGQRLVVDLTSGVSRMEGGRVEGLFQSSRPESGGSGGPGGLPLPSRPPGRPN